MRLLRRTIRLYSYLSFFVLLVGIPVFYFLLQYTVKEEVNEELIVYKAEVVKKLNDVPHSSITNQIHFLDHDVVVSSATVPNSYDSFSTFQRYDSVIHEVVSMRLLKTNVVIQGKPYQILIATPMVDHNDLFQIVMIAQAVLLGLLFAGLWIINRTISSAYLLQKEFTENAAHEMQTPLAVFQSKLELFMQTSPLSDEQAELMGKMADASHRMNKLNKALLLLTKLQNQQFPDRHKVDVAFVVDEMLVQFEDAIAHKNLTVTVKKSNPIVTDTNKTLMEILIGNVLSNAIRHNHQDGFINIILKERELIVENSGTRKALNTFKLFQRFQKEGSDETSTGLGLEIIDKICKLFNYSLSYQYLKPGHRFTLKF